MAEQRFATAVQQVQDLLREAARVLETPVGFALIGGLAVSAWGAVRATEDIDFLADTTPSPILDGGVRQRLAELCARRGWKAEWRHGGIDDPVPLLLRLRMPPEAGGLVAEIIWAHKIWQREALERTIALDVAGMEVVVVHPEDLILLKLYAGGPQDLADIETLLADPPAEIELARLKEKARRLRRSRLLTGCLGRLRSKAAEG